MKYILFFILITSCSLDTFNELNDILKEVDKEEYVEKENEIVKEEELPTPTPSVTPSYSFPNNCDNPPKSVSPHDGFKCIGSATRGESVVCLLPYQYTMKPYKLIKDHHNQEFKCNINNKSFDQAILILKNNKEIPLKYAGCHNPVYLAGGNIGREHFRNEGVKWHEIKNKVKYIKLILNNQTTCLSF
jgi:hypothetical protein